MKTNEHDYYSNLANWSFDDIDYFNLLRINKKNSAKEF